MHTSISADPRLWKRCLQDALFELDSKTFHEKLQIANKAIEMRRLELTSSANPDTVELAELIDGLSTLRALGFLKESNEAVEHR